MLRYFNPSGEVDHFNLKFIRNNTIGTVILPQGSPWPKELEADTASEERWQTHQSQYTKIPGDTKRQAHRGAPDGMVAYVSAKRSLKHKSIPCVSPN